MSYTFPYMQFQISSEPILPPVPPVNTWFGALSEPVRVPPRLITGAQRDLFWNPSTPAPAYNAWYIPLSEPVRVPQRLVTAANPYLFYLRPPELSFGWYAPFSDPMLPKKLRTGDNPDFFWNPSTPPPLMSTWFEALSEPVRYRWYPAAEQAVLAWEPDTLPPPPFMSTWFLAWSEPVRVKPRLITGANPETFRNTFVPTVYTARLQATETGQDTMQASLYQFFIAIAANTSIIQNIVGKFAPPTGIVEPLVVPPTAIIVPSPSGVPPAIPLNVYITESGIAYVTEDGVTFYVTET